MRVLLLAPVFFALLLPLAHAAVVEGTLFDYAFNPVAGIVEVNSTPVQKAVAANGSYRFEVGPGAYLLTATSRDNETASQVLLIRQEGNYRLDMVLLDDLALPPLNDSFIDANADGLPDLEGGIDGASGVEWPWVAVVAVIAAAGAYYFLGHRKRGKEPTGHHPAHSAQAASPPPASAVAELDDEREVLKALDASGGLITQKDLRKALVHWSEARVSIVVTALEAAGKVRKIKKGRGNVIRRA